MVKLSFSECAVRGKLALPFHFRFVKKLIGHVYMKLILFEKTTDCDYILIAHKMFAHPEHFGIFLVYHTFV